MARKLISTFYYPAEDKTRYVFILNKPSGGGARLVREAPTTLQEFVQFMYLVENAACQFKLPIGAVAKVEVYQNVIIENGQQKLELLRYHDVQILNCSGFIGDSDQEALNARYAQLLGDQNFSFETGFQGTCDNTCDGVYYERDDCEDTLALILNCDDKTCTPNE